MQKTYHTKSSELIDQFIEQKKDNGFTAIELSKYLLSRGLNLNKTTVYRNLDKLIASGRLIKLKSIINDGFIYQAAEEEKSCSDHIHFQCKNCGSVIHLDDKETKRYLQTISKKFELNLDLDSSGLYGVCSRCKSK
ncbi:Fur family transcriptional regulator [Treponema sp.]|uniref:Fur family transcriptional regulator n=1 Tax=Treponema sp. TaxID=166 RepID=UPI00298DED55|nr:transcriptional repressor [Treponema sp.]MCR5612601.1 transcriptional repressor [Treponema sp.]